LQKKTIGRNSKRAHFIYYWGTDPYIFHMFFSTNTQSLTRCELLWWPIYSSHCCMCDQPTDPPNKQC
jgi:hypothetical protein